MAVSFFLSGGASNAVPEASIGGTISSNPVQSLILGRVPISAYTSGRVYYRCFYVKTTLDATIKAYIKAETPSTASSIALGWGTSAVNGTEQVVINDATAPASVTFASPMDAAAAAGTAMIANQTKALWVRYTITPTAPIANESFQIAFEDALGQTNTGVASATGVGAATATGGGTSANSANATASGTSGMTAVGGSTTSSGAVASAAGTSGATGVLSAVGRSVFEATGSSSMNGVSTSATLWNPPTETSHIMWFDLSTPGSFNTTTKNWTARWGSFTATPKSTGPTRISNGFDGTKTALSFPFSSDTGLQIASPGFQECVSVIVVKYTPISGQYPQLWTRGNHGNDIASILNFDWGGARAAYVSTPADDYEANFSTNGAIFVSRHTKAARTIRYNGTQTANNSTVVTGTEPASSDSINLINWLSASAIDIQLAVFGVFQGSAWSTGLAERIEGFVAHNNLGVTTAILPSGHPYKSVAP